MRTFAEVSQLAGAVRFEAQARQVIAVRVLGPESYRAQAKGYHLWMPLPSGVDPAEIVNILRPHGLSVVGSEAVVVDRSTTAPTLRVSIGGTISRERLERGLKLLPSDMIPPSAVTAFRTVVGPAVPPCPTGGINPEDMRRYVDAGADGFGFTLMMMNMLAV